MGTANLENWGQTVSGLHQGARLLGAVQRLTQEPQPAFLELGLKPTEQGLAAGKLPSGGRLVLDFFTPSLLYLVDGKESVYYPLNGCTQAQVFEGLFSDLVNGELRDTLPPGEDLFERVSAGIASRQGRYRPPEKGSLLDETPIQIDARSARNYFINLQMVFTGLARFKASLLGAQTPLVVWPHGLDLSSLWFVGKEIDENQPHMNFGFSPRSEGLTAPYFYTYAYPMTRSDTPAPLPEGATWHSEGWKGVLISYDVIAIQPDLANYVEKMSLEIYNLLLPYL